MNKGDVFPIRNHLSQRNFDDYYRAVSKSYLFHINIEIICELTAWCQTTTYYKF